ncbi:hypothetical protein [Xanthocytophaga agilis]|uniref:SPOR domain-containing protein n=1 Tax=Xanthocytophaga agilis TaxID=3048010 RepID=A0AAE3UB24_9BACT|nr:hypothetical protein [Xanthocytophaga agilis]MDJ1499348.1 hypothetical protein [Xanthocytophaga agilis]
MLPDQEYNRDSEQNEEAKEYRLYNYDYPSESDTSSSYQSEEEEDFVSTQDYSTKSSSELEDENEDLRKENDNLKSSAGTLKTLAIIFGVLAFAGIGYILFSHFKAPLFGPIAKEHKEFAAQSEELKKAKSKVDTLQKANDILVEQQPEIEEGVFFEVQLGAFQDFSLDDYQAELAALRQEGDATRKFTFAKFRDYRKAEKLKNDLQRMGVTGAFVVGRINGQRVEDINEAIKASKNR